MFSYNKLVDGISVVVFDSDDRDEVRQMVSWCRKNIGRSHGPRSSTWWILRIAAVNPRTRDHDAIAVRHGPHLFLTRLVWS